jgi:hypothetical protein
MDRACEAELGRQAFGDLGPGPPAVIASVGPDVVLLIQPVAVLTRHDQLVHAEADVVVLSRPVRPKPLVARRERRSIVRGLEDAHALDDREPALRIVGMLEDGRHAEVTGWLVLGIVPLRALRVAIDRAQQRPRRPAVAAFEDARHLGAREDAPVRGGQPGHLRQLQRAVAVIQALARLLPGIAEVAASPDRRAVPVAGRGRVDRARVRRVDRVVDRPALAEGAADLPVAPGSVALEQEYALAGSDKHDRLRHRLTSLQRALWSLHHRRPSWRPKIIDTAVPVSLARSRHASFARDEAFAGPAAAGSERDT